MDQYFYNIVLMYAYTYQKVRTKFPCCARRARWRPCVGTGQRRRSIYAVVVDAGVGPCRDGRPATRCACACRLQQRTRQGLTQAQTRLREFTAWLLLCVRPTAVLPARFAQKTVCPPLRNARSQLGASAQNDAPEGCCSKLKWTACNKAHRRAVGAADSEGKVFLRCYDNIPLYDLDMLMPGSSPNPQIFDALLVFVPLIAGLCTSIYKIVDVRAPRPLRWWLRGAVH